MFFYLIITINICFSQTEISFDSNELNWLEQNPEITLGFTSSLEPQVIVEDDGTLTGILIDIYSEVERLTGLKVNVELDSLSNIIDKANKGVIDGILGSSINLANSLNLLYTDSFSPIVPMVFSTDRYQDQIYNITDLYGKKVGIIKNSIVIEQILEPHKDEIELVFAEDNIELLQLLMNETVDVAYGLSSINFLITKYGFKNIKPIYINDKLDYLLLQR